MPKNSRKKINLNKKTEGILLLYIKKLILRSNTFLPLDFIFIYWFKISHICSGHKKYSHMCQNFVHCRRNISAHRRRRNLWFILFKRSWAGEWFKIETNLKIPKIFVIIVSLQNYMESAPKKQFFKFSFCSFNFSLIHHRKHLKL